MPDPTTTPPSLPAHLEAFREQPFPTDQLPEAVQAYVRLQSMSCGLDEGSVAMTALAVIAGLIPESWTMPSGTGSAVGLRFNLVLGLPESPSAALMLAELVRPLETRQREALRQASQMDSAALKKMQASPAGFLPAALQQRLQSRDGADPAAVRRQWIAGLCRPAFLLRNPDAAGLRAGLANSADHSILAVFDDLITPWLAATPARGDRELVELLTHLARGGPLVLPGQGAASALVQPGVSFVSTTSQASFDSILGGSRLGDPILGDALLIRGQARPVEYASEWDASKTAWHDQLADFLAARQEPPPRPCLTSARFRQAVLEWRGVLNTVFANDFAPIRRHARFYLELPLKLAGIFQSFPADRGGDIDLFLKGQIVTEWLLIRQLMATQAAKVLEVVDQLAEAKQRMLAKIIEFGPIEPVALRRRFKVQDKAVHAPVLEALVQEKLVRVNESGQLIAA